MRPIDWVAVTVLLLFASGLRILGMSYGQLNPEYFPSTAPYGMVHEQQPIQPDEYFSVAVPMDMAMRQNLNPRFFNYPGFLSNTNFVMFHLTGALDGLSYDDRKGENLRTYAEFPLYVMSRMYSVFGGLLMVACAYAISRRVAGLYAGLASALLVAVTYTLVQHAHYVKPGTLATGWMMLATWASVTALYTTHVRHRERFYVLAGMVTGLAITTRYNAGAVGLIVGLVGLILLYRHRTRRMLLTVLLSWLLIPTVFLLGSPYTLIDFDSFWKDFTHIVGMFTATGENVPDHFLVEPMVGLQWMLTYLVLFAIGIAAIVYAGVGVVHNIWKRPAGNLLKQNSRALYSLIILLLVVAYIWITFRTIRPGHSDNVMILVLPFIALLAGLGADALVKVLPFSIRVTMPIVLLVLILQPLVLSVQVIEMFTQRDTRVVMLDWIHEHVPDGSHIFLNGAYNVPLDGAIYPNDQQFGRYATILPSGDDYDYMIYSDALAFDILRSEAIVPPDMIDYQRQYVRDMDAQFSRVVEIPRPVWTGSEAMMNMAVYWHNPALIVYCLNAESCRAVNIE